jgi:CHRD domain
MTKAATDDGRSRGVEEDGMRKLVATGLVSVASLALVAGAFGSGAAETYSFSGKLTAAQEVPKPVGAKATAAGNFSAKSTETSTKITIRWTLTFRNLTGKAVAAHIHKGKKGLAGPVIVALCGPCRNGQTGTKTIDSDTEEALEKGLTYVNVHTAKNAGGEIRAQIKLVGKS